MKSHAIAPFTALFWAAAASAGVGGAGNTGDSSIGFDFARGTAVNILQAVSVEALRDTVGSEPVTHLYDGCRETMYVGALRTRFELVDDIPDGVGYHAIAQRRPGNVILIGRHEMTKLIEAGLFNGSLLTGIVLHEVGHDCVLDGKSVTDERDPDLNRLAQALIQASDSGAAAHLITLDFIERVRAGTPVRLLDLSAALRTRLTDKYLDYVGDWAYLRDRAHFTDRPAPASDFTADLDTSWFPGWSSVQAASPVTASVRDLLLAPGYRAANPSYLVAGASQALPTELRCAQKAAPPGAPSAVACELAISWESIPNPALSAVRVKMNFDLDLFGKLQIEKVRMIE